MRRTRWAAALAGCALLLAGCSSVPTTGVAGLGGGPGEVTIQAGDDEIPALLDEAIVTFGLRGASLLRRDDADSPWQLVAGRRESPLTPEAGTDAAMVGDNVALVVDGDSLSASEHGLLVAFAAHAAARLDREELSAEAKQARALAEGKIARDGDVEGPDAPTVRSEAIPVRCGDDVIAVLKRQLTGGTGAG